MAVKLRPSKQILQVEAVTGLLLFTHHKQTSMRTDGETYIGKQEHMLTTVKRS